MTSNTSPPGSRIIHALVRLAACLTLAFSMWTVVDAHMDDPSAQTSNQGCTPDEFTLCLQGGRFMVEIDWVDFVGNRGAGRVAPATTPDSGLFYFYGPNNWEVLVKVLDGCAQNNHFWVFGAGATNLGFSMSVTDTMTGVTKYYANPLGHVALSITDTEALATCSGVGAPTPTPTPQHTATPHPTVTPHPTATPTPVPTPFFTPPPACCKVCTTGKPCGNSCISRNFTCHQPPGCAC